MKEKPVVLTIGTFDGVHRGHQRLLSVARRRARALEGEVLAVAFDRPPRLFFSPLPPPTLLTTPPEKEVLLRAYGADRVETIAFSQALANLTAEQFFLRFIQKRWNASEIVVGFNFCFGKGREGTVETLAARGTSSGIVVHSVGPVRDSGGVVSSGRIRPLMAEGRVQESRRLLGHAYTVDAPVVRGRGVGRRLGFPTANLDVGKDKILPKGVFAVHVLLPTGVARRGVLNIGVRPTFRSALPRPSVEVHVLDFSGDLTGRRLRLGFLRKIRNEKKFPTPHALAKRIALDESAARKIGHRLETPGKDIP
jgi:riboflavin kinase/FMN adenylyltransferase